PEHGSTAAGVRTAQLLRVLGSETGGGGGSGSEGRANRLHFMSPARRNVYSQELEAAGIATYQCAPNRAAEFHEVLDAVQPTIAVFDRSAVVTTPREWQQSHWPWHLRHLWLHLFALSLTPAIVVRVPSNSPLPPCNRLFPAPPLLPSHLPLPLPSFTPL
ncbi:unnamed protein product, partial [Closterium sp. NIES-54]